MPSKIRRELISHLLEYEYFIEKALSMIIGFVILALLIILPNWPLVLYEYIQSPSAFTLRNIGISMMITMLILTALFTAYLIPHFDPTLRPHGFRATRDKRMLNIYLALISSLLAITVLGYLLYTLFIYVLK